MRPTTLNHAIDRRPGCSCRRDRADARVLVRERRRQPRDERSAVRADLCRDGGREGGRDRTALLLCVREGVREAGDEDRHELGQMYRKRRAAARHEKKRSRVRRRAATLVAEEAASPRTRPRGSVVDGLDDVADSEEARTELASALARAKAEDDSASDFSS